MDAALEYLGGTLKLLGALGIFIYGMKVMSDGIQKAAGARLRKILSTMTSNMYTGIFTGFLVTTLVQSSSATTVMVVSFVNAGLLTLTESLGVIMGANIGTTVTAWLVTIFGFAGKLKITALATILIGISFPFIFAKRPLARHIAEFIMGFGILFIGLDFLKNSVPDVKKEILSEANAPAEILVLRDSISYAHTSFSFQNLKLDQDSIDLPSIQKKHHNLLILKKSFALTDDSISDNGFLVLKDSLILTNKKDVNTTSDANDGTKAVVSFLSNYSNKGMLSVILFVLVGILLTVVVQSSSASTAITLVMVSQGWINFPNAAAMFLGSNIGTTITAFLAAMVGNVHAKRSARFHAFFNIIGSIWVLAIFYWFLDLIDWMLIAVGYTDDSILAMDLTTLDEHDNTILVGLSMFHTTFNILNTVVMIPFAKLLEKLVISITPSKGNDKEKQLLYISGGLLTTPELSISEAHKEIQNMLKLVDKMCVSYMVLLFEKPKNKLKLVEKIKKREQITDDIEIEIAQYLSRCAEGEISSTASNRIRNMMVMTNDIERIGDHFFRMAVASEKLIELNTKFPEDAKNDLKEMADIVYKAIKNSRKYLAMLPSDIKDIELGYEIEREINEQRDKIRQKHYERMSNNVYPVPIGVIFWDIIGSFEKVGDHLININEASIGNK